MSEEAWLEYTSAAGEHRLVKDLEITEEAIQDAERERARAALASVVVDF